MTKTSPTRVTIKDVAHKAGVGYATVSEALNGRGRLSPARRSQIQQIAADMGYSPRTAARLLRTKHSGRLGIVVAQPDPEIAVRWTGFGGLVAEIMKQAPARGLVCELDFCAAGDTADRWQPPEHLAGGLVDGALVMGRLGEHCKRWLAEHNDKPWVQLTEPAPRCVLSGDAQMIEQAADHLAQLGHGRVALFAGPPKHHAHHMSVRSFQAAVARHGFEVVASSWIHAAQALGANDLRQNMEAARTWAQRVLDNQVRPTAIICMNATQGHAVIEAARRCGLRVPEDLSVVTRGDELNACRAYPFLTTVARDRAEQIRRAIVLLQQAVDNPALPPEEQHVPPTLQVRDSTGPVPTAD